MRILLVSAYGSSRNTGGVAVHLRSLREELARRGHELRWMASLPPGGPGAAPDGGMVYVPPPLRDHVPWRFHRNTVRAYREAARTFRPDVVHIHSRTGLSLYRAAAGRPLLTTVHFSPSLSEPGGVLSRLHPVAAVERLVDAFQFRCIMAGSRRVFAVSEETRRQFIGRYPGAGAARMEVVSPGIDLARFGRVPRDEARARLGSDGRYVVLFAARMVRGKGALDLLRAVPSLGERIPGLQVVFAGDGPLGEVVKREAAARGLGDRVRFAGHVPHETMPFYHRAADLFVNPTKFTESFGIATGEAMAAGTPVVVSAPGAASLALTGGEALVYDPPGGLEEAVRACFEEPGAAARRARAARVVIERHSLTRTADLVEAAYGETVRGAGERGGASCGGPATFRFVAVLSAAVHRLKAVRHLSTPGEVPP